MASGRIVIPNYMPALDLNADPVAGARIYFYLNETTTLQSVYADDALTVPHTNPVVAGADGVFPTIFANITAVYSVSITDASGAPIGGLQNHNGIQGAESTNFKVDLDGGNLTDQSTFRASQHLYEPVAEDRGAVGNGVTDDAGALAALLVEAGPAGSALLNPRDYKVSSFDNVEGVHLNGAGRILSDFPGGGQVQLNSYCDQGKPYIGAEYLFRVMARIKAGGTLKAFIYGDSTVARGQGTLTGAIAGTTLTVSNANGQTVNIGSVLTGSGMTQCTVTAYGTGVGGNGTYTVSVSQTFASGTVTIDNGGGYAGAEGEPQRLIPRILKRKGLRVAYNFVSRAVGGTSVAQMQAVQDIDTVSGTTDLFIIKYGINDALVGLPAFAANLDAKLTAIRANSHGTPDQLSIMLISPNATFNPPIGHTNIWYEALRGVYENAARKHRCFYFDTYAAMRDVSWTFGIPGIQYMDSIGVHPGEIMQGQIWGRVWDAAIGFSDLSLYDNNDLVGLGGANSWTNYTTGSDGFSVASCWMGRDGEVTVQGDLRSGTMAQYTTVGTLPVGYRPQNNETFTCHCSDGGANTALAPILVTTAGDLQLLATIAHNARLSLSGISFRTR